MRARSLQGVLAVLLVVVGVLGCRLVHVHQETWQWRLTQTATPPKLHVLSRDYRRADRNEAPPSMARPLGKTPGGALVVGEAVRSLAPTVIWVQSHQAFAVYTLMGGP